MPTSDVRFIRESALAWRALHRISRVFVTKAIVARDVRGRSREQLAADIVNDGLGPRASVWGRDHAVEMLTYAVPIVATAAYVPLLVGALLVRPIFGGPATGNVLALAAAVLFPVLGLVVPLSVRFARARHQLRAWEARGEPEDEQPVDGSLPRGVDAVIGMSIGGVLSIMMIAGVILGPSR
ncbi:hypothetical protein [Cellulomonas sp. KRMCY2]|uniref:hypothetical protein n=1 Tax=Cellulomonas sp. KRMCY2 TaxID=1304865 RepID=UPI00045EA7A4|nr:hypothetical protein [Cellulomonas sp. KRMCY2]